jgi:hypothetical protein
VSIEKCSLVIASPGKRSLVLRLLLSGYKYLFSGKEIRGRCSVWGVVAHVRIPYLSGKGVRVVAHVRIPNLSGKGVRVIAHVRIPNLSASGIWACAQFLDKKKYISVKGFDKCSSSETTLFSL